MVTGDAGELADSGLWDVIKCGVGDYHDDRNALGAFLRAVPLEMQAGLTIKPSVHEA